jgi:dihydroorotate dehydrogenase electron transfer subunit
MHHSPLTVADQRAAGGLRWLTLHAPGLARAARPGQYLLLRCAEPGSDDPLLRRALLLAAADERLGQVGLLYAPDERGLRWLSRARTGDQIDALGPFGQPFVLERRTRTLLLIGEGPGLAALLLLAARAVARGCAVALLAGAPTAELLPPPFLLPAEVEYQSVVGAAARLFAQPGGTAGEDRRKKRKGDRQKGDRAPDLQPPGAGLQSLFSWADQLCAALPAAQLPALSAAVRTAKYRWERGYATVLLDGPLVCGVGACAVCTVETRRGPRLRCTDGPVFDLRDLAAGA